MSEPMTCQSKDLLLTFLYGEATPAEQEAVEAHLLACDECRNELDALTGVRTALTHWDAPALGVHFRVVAEDAKRAPRHLRWRAALPLAAAAVLVLAAAAGLANIELRYGADGFTFRTGWGREPAPQSRGGENVPGAIVRPSSGAAASAPWRADLVALEQQLRREFRSPAVGGAMATIGAEGSRVVPVTTTDRMSDQELLRRVQQLIDDSEARQQQNLALRVNELSRDFNGQREADLVQIQQGFGRIEGRTEVEAARAREMMNYIVRVSQQQPR